MSKIVSSKKLGKKEKLIGEIIHYFGNVKVAVIKLKADLKIGDNIRITGGEIDFEQPVKSMQIEHKKIEKSKAKQKIGLKVKKKVRQGYKVYKIIA